MQAVRPRFLIALGLVALAAGLWHLTISLPSRYDLRAVGGQQLVHTRGDDQLHGGPCWAFAALCAAESNILVQGLWEGDPNALNLSEQWLRLRESRRYGARPASADQAAIPGFLRGPNEGGHWDIAMVHLASGRGPLTETELPYTWRNDPSAYPAPAQPPGEPLWILDSCREYIGPKAVKRAILADGAIHSWMTHRRRGFQPARTPDQLGTYFDDGMLDLAPDDLGSQHAITIIGWDDHQPTQAPEPGAWLITQSQPDPPGTPLAEQRHPSTFWIAYQSYGFLVPRGVVFRLRPRLPGERHLWANYGPPRGQALLPQGADPSQAAVVFVTGEQPLRLHSLAFMNAGERKRAYTIRLYDQAAALFAGEAPRFSHSSCVRGSGLERILLPTAIVLPARQGFAISLEMDGGAPMAHGHRSIPFIPACIEAIPAGRCYYRNTAGTWHDLADWNDSTTPGHSLAWCLGASARRKE